MPQQTSEQWWVVIDDASGEARSFGTVVADPLPAGLLAIELPHAPAGYQWDASTRALVEVVDEPSEEADVPVTRAEFSAQQEALDWLTNYVITGEA